MTIQTQPTGTSPISELRDNTLNPNFIPHVNCFLQAHRGSCSYMSDGSCLFLFPPGTIETRDDDRPYFSKSTIIFPSGLRLTKVVREPLLQEHRQLVSLLFPNQIYKRVVERNLHHVDI
jgi:hypothetical protein